MGQTSTIASWDSVYHPGNVCVIAAGGVGFAFSLAACSGIEVIVASVKADDYIPFDFGIMAMGMYNWFSRNQDGRRFGWNAFGGGAFATVHLTFDNLEAHSTPFLEGFDFYTGFGAVYTYLDFTGEYTTSEPPGFGGVGLATLLGFNYYLAKWFALRVELASWSFTGGLTAGLVLKI